MNNTHILFIDDKDGNTELYYKKLNSQGANVTGDLRITTTPTSSGQPAIAIDSNQYLHVAWQDYAYGNGDIFYKKLNNNGVTVSPDIQVSSTVGFGSGSASPNIGVDNQNNVHVVWDKYIGGGYNSAIFYKKLNNNGINLTPELQVSGQVTSNSPSASVDSLGRVHIAAEMNTYYPNGVMIQYILLNNTGSVMTTAQITSALWYADDFAPVIAIDKNDDAHVVWSQSGLYGNSLLYEKVNSSGSVISPYYIYVCGTSSHALAVDSRGDAHIVCTNQNLPAQSEMYYTKINGTTISVIIPNTRLTFDPGSSYSPHVAVASNGDPQLIWAEDRDGNLELYEKRVIEKQKCAGSGNVTSSGHIGKNNCLDKKIKELLADLDVVCGQ